MRDKILLNVLLPVARRSFEFRVPLDLTVEEGTQLISALVASREPARYESSSDAGLMHLEGPAAGVALHPDESFRAIAENDEITDGSRLALV